MQITDEKDALLKEKAALLEEKAALLKEQDALSKALVSNYSKLLGASSPEKLSEICDTIKFACEIVLSSNGKTTP